MFFRWIGTHVAFLLAISWVGARAHSQWQIVTRAEPTEKIWTTVAFHQPRIEEAVELLMNISDPQSSTFGQYPDGETVDSMFAPSQRARRAVYSWLGNAGISRNGMRIRKGKALLDFTATVSQVEQLLNTKLNLIRHSDTGEKRLGDTGYEIPVDMKEYIEFIVPASDIPYAPKGNRRRTSRQTITTSPPYRNRCTAPHGLESCMLSWTPECIRELYGIPAREKGRVPKNNSIGIFGFGDIFVQDDLNNFFSKFAQDIPNATTPLIRYINGAKNVSEYIDGEESLDLQMAYPIVYPQTVEIFQTPYNSAGGIANDFLDAVDPSYCHFDGGDDPSFDPQYPAFEGFQGPAMCGTMNVSNVVSISFAPDESGLTAHYVQRQCYEWMKLALRGVTVLAASGDTGVQGGMGCSPGPEGTNITAFNPLFPGTCPYVTAVGATQVNFESGAHKEVAVDDPKHHFWSGGGFSNFMSRPQYQNEAVTKYLSMHDPEYPAGTYNRHGRAFPDVALLGANVTMSDHLDIVVSGGTSAAAPLFAAMINRINDERILAKKKPIGFLNQILYQHPEVFTDITEGHNPGCGTDGFKAAHGWDPVSGLGSPKFPKLFDLLVGLP